MGDYNVEPIVPLGALISEAGCTMQWTEDHVVVHHPTKGQINTYLHGGCPMISKEAAMELIAELEGNPSVRQLLPDEDPRESAEILEWLNRLVDEHPAFQGVPDELRQELKTIPRAGTLLGNKRLRRYWQKNRNAAVHLYAGPDDSTTFKRTAKEMGMDDRQVIEIDVLRGPQWDMCGEDLYAELMHSL